MEFLKRSVFLIFFGAIFVAATAQDLSSIHLSSSSPLEKEFAALMNDLELRNDQKLSLGILVLKYSSTFNYVEFADATKARQYTMTRSLMKDLDRDLKEILDKKQFKVYKKHKRIIKKELRKSV